MVMAMLALLVGCCKTLANAVSDTYRTRSMYGLMVEEKGVWEHWGKAGKGEFISSVCYTKIPNSRMIVDQQWGPGP